MLCGFSEAQTVIELQTPRLLLRQWRDEDLADFAALNGDAEVMRYFPAPLLTLRTLLGMLRGEICVPE